MHVIYCVWWAILFGRPRDCRAAVLSLVPLQMSTVREVWICDRLADSPSPASSQPACQQHLLLLREWCSACCATFDTMGFCGSFFPSFLLWFFFFLPSFTAPFELSSVFSLGNVPSKEGMFTYLKTLGKTLLHFGWEGIVVFGGRWVGNSDVSSCVNQETVYTTVLFVPMDFLLRMLMAYSPRLVPFSSFLSGFLQINNFTQWG